MKPELSPHSTVSDIVSAPSLVLRLKRKGKRVLKPLLQRLPGSLKTPWVRAQSSPTTPNDLATRQDRLEELCALLLAKFNSRPGALDHSTCTVNSGRLHRYRSELGGDSKDVIEERCNEIARVSAEQKLINSFAYYERTIRHLRSIPGLQFVKLENILNHDGKRIALRHDIDADIVTGIRCARHLAELELPASFFVLHTSHYYGRHEKRDGNVVFVRHKGFKDLLKQLQDTGAEIGIHNDALGVIFDHGVDGIAHFIGELSWLREMGVNIRSTVAHNSAAVFGAENFEIFNGFSAGDRRILRHAGRAVRLQTLDMSELGLAYEGNHPRPRPAFESDRLRALMFDHLDDALRDPIWLHHYFINHPIFERGYDYDAWLIGEDTWVLAGKGEVTYPLTLDELTEVLDDLPDPSSIVVSIHPIYVGLRAVKTNLGAQPAAVAPNLPESVPEEFGFWWEKEESDLRWYDWMFQHRLRAHQSFIAWLRQWEAKFGPFESVLDAGCGRGVFYPHYFADRRYTGLEYSGRNTAWLKENRKWPGHSFVQGDIGSWTGAEKHDLVFSSGTIDNVPDMDAFLRGMVRNARKTIYLTAYRGWFPELLEHRMTYSADTGAYYNDISPSQARRVLEDLGCTNIVIEPLPTGLTEIPYETVIIADVPA